MKKEYKTYGWQELIEDQSFIHWVRGTDDESARFWENLVLQNPEMEAQVSLAKDIILSIQFRDLNPGSQAEERLWSKIENRIAIAEPTRRHWVRWFVPAAAAAILLLVIFRNLWSPESIQTLLVSNGEKKEQLLPDGSMVRLNSGSEIAWDSKVFPKQRTIQLKGEGFFEVEKGAGFEVLSESGIVKVLGTKFNVFDREGYMEVSCYSGKVAVQFKGSDETFTLLPGDRVNNQTLKLEQSSFVPSEAKIWKDGFIYFQQDALSFVLQEFQRQYDIKELNLPKEIGQMKYSGFFRTNNIEEAIQSICLPLQLKYQLQDGKLSLDRNQ